MGGHLALPIIFRSFRAAALPTHILTRHPLSLPPSLLTRPCASLARQLAVYTGRYDQQALPEVKSFMTYRMYDLGGHNMEATGLLSDILELHADGTFEARVPFANEAGNFDYERGHYKFVLDIFMEEEGTHEATCIEVENIELCAELSRKDDRYVMNCEDNGDGTFTPANPPIPLPCTPIDAPECKPPTPPAADCDLEWWYCPRDPDCDAYTMSAEHVAVRTDIGTEERSFFAPGDVVDVVVTGHTSMTEIPPQGTYRVYMLAGGNAAMGDLYDVLNIDFETGAFLMTIPFTLSEGNFESNLGWFEFGIDVFQEAAGTDEAMCVEVANIPYREAMQAKEHPKFEQYCVDEGMGHFIPQTIDTVVNEAECDLHASRTQDDDV